MPEVDSWIEQIGAFSLRFLPVLGMILWSLVSTMGTDVLSAPEQNSQTRPLSFLQALSVNISVAGLSAVMTLISVDVISGPHFTRIAIHGVTIAVMVSALIGTIWTNSISNETWKRWLVIIAIFICILMGIFSALASSIPGRNLPQKVAIKPISQTSQFNQQEEAR